MKIFHGPKSWNFQAESLAEAEQSIGLNSKAFNYKDLYSNPLLIASIIKEYDIFNFYTTYTFLPISIRWKFLYSNYLGLDLYLLKKLNKKIILHFQGCDIRNPYHELAAIACSNCDVKEIYCNKDYLSKRRKMLEKIITLADAVCITTPDLAHYIDYKTHLIPKILPDYNEYSYKKYNNKKILKIIHAPSDRSIKGTNTIISVVENINDKFELLLIENMSKKELLNFAETADLAIDQLRVGWYGNFAVEMMSLGLPVIAYIDSKLIKDINVSNFPIINSTENNLEETLLSLFDNISLLEKSSLDSINFVKDFHSKEIIGKKMLEIYNSLQLG